MLNLSDFQINFSFISKIDVLQYLKPNGIVLLNCPFEINELDKFFTSDFVANLKEKNAKLYISHFYSAYDNLSNLISLNLFKPNDEALLKQSS